MSKSEMIERQVDGSTARYYLAAPHNERGPGVVVLHAWWGLTAFVKEVCDRLAEEGFVAVAPDLFDGRVANTIEEAEALAEQSDYVETKSRVTGAVQVLLDHPKMHGEKFGVVGFSFGAGWALLLSMLDPAEIAAVVTFYGTGMTDFSRSQAAYLGHYVEADPYEPLEDVRLLLDALRGAGREATFHVYPGVGHWFAETDRPDAYDPEAAHLAWDRTIEFLKKHLE